MTQNSFDVKYDRWMDKIDRIEDKTYDDIPPDKKLALYDKVIDMYEELIDNCLEIEMDNPELCPNSDEARQHLRDAQRRRDEYYRAEYVGEPVIKSDESVIKPQPPATKAEMQARFAELMKDVPKKVSHTPEPDAVSKKAGCLVYLGFFAAGAATILYLV